MKILYLTNIEVPYRTRFFDLLSREVELTVAYERESSTTRDAKWASSEKGSYSKVVFKSVKVKGEQGISPELFALLKRGWDMVIVGCYNSPAQMAAIMWMRRHRQPYVVNLDGEQFIGKSLKSMVKRFFLRGAKGYLIAGKLAADSLKRAIGNDAPVKAYLFSSLDEERAKIDRSATRRGGKGVLVVGQYAPYKGLDVAIDTARKMPSIRFTFVGTGNRCEEFIRDNEPLPANVDVQPFLQRAALRERYLDSDVMLLPSRRECWGLVVNEAAALGLPIVSTRGSGAAVEFMDASYSELLSEPGSASSLTAALEKFFAMPEEGKEEYSRYLRERSKDYTIEENVETTVEFLKSLVG